MTPFDIKGFKGAERSCGVLLVQASQDLIVCTTCFDKFGM
jgi:hypothetical protein